MWRKMAPRVARPAPWGSGLVQPRRRAALETQRLPRWLSVAPSSSTVSQQSGEQTCEPSVSASAFADFVRRCGLSKKKLHTQFYPEERGLSAPPGEFPIAVAVSGGADSMALMLLLREYLHSNRIKTPLLAITVDHQLRAESAAEAQEVARVCTERWGIQHVTRTCEWMGEEEEKAQREGGRGAATKSSGLVKPRESKMEEQARLYRYDLLRQVCQENRVRCLFVAHNQGDQLETMLFRLGRASGINGLAGMSNQTPFFSLDGAVDSSDGGEDTNTDKQVRLLRPLLSVTKTQLMATCQRFGQSWAHDPSNDDPVYDRVRIRQELQRVEAEQGPEILELFSKLQQTAEKAKKEFAREERRMMRKHVVLWTPQSVIVRMSVFYDPEMFEELLYRVLSEIIVSMGSKDSPPRLAAMVRLAVSLKDLETGKQLTLGGCRIKKTSKGNRVLFQPEHPKKKNSPSRKKV